MSLTLSLLPAAVTTILIIPVAAVLFIGIKTFG
jgi:hypothetical protein